LLAAGGKEMKWMKCALALVLCLSLAVLPALGVDGFPKTIVDSANRTVTIDKPVEKIVPLVTWSYEPIYLLGLENKIVGVTSNAQKVYPWLQGISSKPVVGTYREHDYEKIIELRPDIVITQSRYAGALEGNLSGIKVIVLDFSKPAGFEKELTILGEITGNSQKAGEFLAWRQRILENLKSKTAAMKPEDKLRVYCEWSDYPWLTGGAGSAKDVAITLAGGVNIASNLTAPRPEVDPEWVLKENPQAVLFSASSTYTEDSLTGYNYTSTDNARKFLENVTTRLGLNGTDAVKGNRLYVLDEMCVEAARNFLGAEYLAKWLYPEQFKDMDPEVVHKEYFEKWLGVPYKGIWAYLDAS
jgi:iron complex transport system substrate-binding protein